MHGADRSTGAAARRLDSPIDLSARTPVPVASLAALPGRVVRWYVVVAASWILLSDLAVADAAGDPWDERLVDLSKGMGFVVVTGALLWFVLRQLTSRHDRILGHTVVAQRDFYQAVLATSSDVIAIFGGDGRVRYVNHAAADLLGWNPEAMVGRKGREFIHPDDRVPAVGFMENAVAKGKATHSRRTFLVCHVDGSHRSMEVTAAPIDIGEPLPGVVVNARDVTDRVRSDRQLRAALAQDVTGLPGLRAFEAEMERLVQTSPAGTRVAVLLLDIDRFGDLNSLHGRGGGDVVLRELARRFEAALPRAVGLWRHGADELLAVVTDRTDPAISGSAADLQAVVDLVQAEMAAPFALDEAHRRVSVSVSIGLSRVELGDRRGGERFGTTLLRVGESALTEAKSHPDRTALHLHDRAEDHVGDRARLVAELHDAVEHDQLQVYYQPKVRLADGVVVGAEALVRWEHPERGLLAPTEFLPAIEEANLSAALTRLVLRRSLTEMARWQRSGCDASFMVAVNIASDDLRRKSFVDDVFAALDESGVTSDRLCLELTEQTMLADPAGARRVIDQLRHAGIGVAIDDFGTGFSALEHVRLFEVDEIKIDKGFVQRLVDSPADEAIVEAVLAIAHRLGVVVTAEGIEDRAALDRLRVRGCELGQGYLFSRAVPAAEFLPDWRYSVGD